MTLSNKFNTYGIKLPILLYVIGFFVHNVYLSKYSFFESSILQTQYIFSGSVAFAIITGTIIFFILRLDLEKISNNLKPYNLLAWIVRFPILTLFIYILTIGSNPLIDGFLQQKVGRNAAFIIVFILYNLVYCYFFGLLFVSFGYYKLKDNKWIEPIKKLYAIISIPLIVLVYYISQYYSQLKNIWNFVALELIHK